MVQGKSAGEDAAAALVISFRGAGALLVDGLRVQEGDPPGVAPGPIAEPVKGNRIFNSSFELGADGWTLAERVKLVREACPDGATFARLVPGPLPPLEGRPFPAQSGQRYTVSGYLRSSEPGARVEIAAVEVGGAARVGRTFDLTPEWKRYSFAAPLPCEQRSRYFVAVRRAAGAQAVNVDAVQVEEGDLSEYAPAAGVEVGLALTRRKLFPEPNEMVDARVLVYARGKVPPTPPSGTARKASMGRPSSWGPQPCRPAARTPKPRSGSGSRCSARFA